MEKLNEKNAVTEELLNDELDGVFIDEMDTDTEGYIETRYLVERKPFESNKTKDRMLYGYTVRALLKRKSPTGEIVSQEFNINLSPALTKDSDNNNVKDGGLYMLLDMIYLADTAVPLYVKESEFTDSAGEKRKIFNYAVICGSILVVLKPRGKSDKTVLESIIKPYFK